jgi:MarR family transcriptional regulator, 2-MHQ and catechol-resistance regulon repressor
MSSQMQSLKLWVVLARAHAAVAEQAEADVTRHGLTLAEFGVLEALYHKGPLLLGELQRKVLVSSGGMTWLVNRLSERGLVERRACKDDKRARYAALTRAGRRLMERIFPEHQAVLQEVLSSLTWAEQEQAIELLKKLGHGAAARVHAAEEIQ